VEIQLREVPRGQPSYLPARRSYSSVSLYSCSIYSNIFTCDPVYKPSAVLAKYTFYTGPTSVIVPVVLGTCRYCTAVRVPPQDSIFTALCLTMRDNLYNAENIVVSQENICIWVLVDKNGVTNQWNIWDLLFWLIYNRIYHQLYLQLLLLVLKDTVA
jgi:hypothetical protein